MRKIGNTYVSYYTATDAQRTSQTCVGAATADKILGPYTSQASPIAYPLSQREAIDPSGFSDTDGTHCVFTRSMETALDMEDAVATLLARLSLRRSCFKNSPRMV